MNESRHTVSYSQWLRLFVVFILSAQIAHGQFEDYNSTIYRAEPGLHNGVKYDGHQDHLGRMWIRSINGVSIYDGNRFVPAGFQINDSVRTQTMKVIDIANADATVYACGEMGLFRYEEEEGMLVSCMQHFIPHHGQIIPAFNKMIHIDKSIFISSYIGIHEYVIDTEQWIYYDLRPDVEHQNNHHSIKRFDSFIHLDNRPNELFVAGRNFLFSFDIATRKEGYRIQYGTKNLSCHELLDIGDDRLCLFTYGDGVNIIDLDKRDRVWNYNVAEIGFNNEDFLITLDGILLDSSIVVGADARGKMYYFDKNTRHVKLVEDPRVISDATGLQIDRDDNIWIFGGNLIQKLSPKSYRVFPIEKKDKSVISNFAVDYSGQNVLINHPSYYTGFYRISDEKSNLEQTGNDTYKIGYSRDEDVFLRQSDANTFDKINPRTFDDEDVFESIDDLEYIDFEVYRDRYYFAYEDRLSICDNEGGLVTQISFNPSFSLSATLRTFYLSVIDEKEVFLSNANCLLRIDIRSEKVQVIWKDGQQDVRKVIRRDDGSYILINEDNGLLTIAIDEGGSVYSERSELDIDQISSGTNGLIVHDTILWITTYDGLVAYNMNANSIVKVINSNGEWGYMKTTICESVDHLWVGTDSELIRVDKLLGSIPQIHAIILKRIEINDKRIVSSINKFSHKEKNLRIDWQAPYFGTPQQLRYYTKLEGRDDHWISAGSNTFKYYNGLPHGEYSLAIKAEAPGTSLVREDIYNFTISAPWYQTGWFYGIAMFLLCLGVYQIYAYKVRQAVEESELKKKIALLELKALRAQFNPHFIFNSLNSIKRLIQKSQNREAIDYLLLFSAMIRNILDMSDQGAVTITEELAFSEQYLKMEKLRFEEKFSFSIAKDEGFYLEDITLPPMILQPHLENAIWHGIMPLEDRIGHLTVNVKDSQNSVKVIIEDNGIGRKAAEEINEKNQNYKHKSKGQSLSVDRIKLNALTEERDIRIDIIDKYEHGNASGTKVVIEIKKVYK